MRRCTAGTALLLATVLLSAPVAAEEDSRPSDPTAAAEALFEEALLLGEQGNHREACRKLEASQALDAAVGTLLRLADCYERIGRFASAWAGFKEARSLARAQKMTERERIAALRAASLGPKMARLTIKVPDRPPPGLSVVLGRLQVPSASWGSALPLDPGRIRVEASAPGYLPFRQELEVPAKDGARLTVQIPELVPELSAPAPTRTIKVRSQRAAAPPRHVAGRGSAMRGAGIGLAIPGGLGLMASGALALASAKRNDASLEHCPDSANLCTPRGVQLREEAARLADYATLAAAVGGSLAAAGVAIYLLAPSGAPERITVGVAAKPERGLGLVAQGAF
jgi:hypothetical protein